MVSSKVFISRVHAICSPKNLAAELEFLKSVFIENGYDQTYVKKIIDTYRPGQQRKPKDDDFKNTASIPWIPGLSTKLKKPFKNAGIKVTFKYTSNLQSISFVRRTSQQSISSQIRRIHDSLLMR